MLVSECKDGSLNGFLAMSTHPSFSMIGPGVFADEEAVAVLLWSALDGLRGKTLVFLVSCACRQPRAQGLWCVHEMSSFTSPNPPCPSCLQKASSAPPFMPETA
jgi:hypothetical protein